MSFPITKTDLFQELSPEQQQLLSGGEFRDSMDGSDSEFGQDQFDGRRRDDRDSEKRVSRIPIRLTGILEVVK